MPTPLTWIIDEQVAATLTPALAYQAVEDALVAHANGRIDQPLKPYVRPGGREHEYERGRLIVMPAWVGEPVNALGTKLISSVPKNIELGLPRASGLVVLNDPTTGFPMAALECATLSARRTGAVAAVACKRLGTAGGTLALVGAGPINREVALAIAAAGRPVAQVRIFDLNPTRADQLQCLLAPRMGTEIVVAPSLRECLAGASTVITATTGAKGYIDPAWVREARLIIPLSLDDFRVETLLSADKIIVDDFEQCAREEKLFHRAVRDGLLDRSCIYAELGEIVAGLKPGRTGDEIIYCNLMGMAVEDIAVAKAVYDRVHAG